jgi:hypothetical protein
LVVGSVMAAGEDAVVVAGSPAPAVDADNAELAECAARAWSTMSNVATTAAHTSTFQAKARRTG